MGKGSVKTGPVVWSNWIKRKQAKKLTADTPPPIYSKSVKTCAGMSPMERSDHLRAQSNKKWNGKGKDYGKV